ncbi:MAG: pirin family protein [Actinomycetota bacterium]
MVIVRRDAEIHREDGGWFSARWHFSFDRYHDPENMGWGALRVFNDDRLIEGATWPMHPHRDVEGITYVVEGTFEHADSLSNGGVLPAGSVQRMTLGRGAWHSESNHSRTEPMRFLQLWILPDRTDLEPEVEQKIFTLEDRTDRLLCVLNPDGSGGALKVHRDSSMFISRMNAGLELEHRFAAGRGGYLYLISGELLLGPERLSTGDAAKIAGESSISLHAEDVCELVLVDVSLP